MRANRRDRQRRWAMLATVSAVGCGSSGSGASGEVPWDDRVQVVSAQGDVREIAAPSGGDCVAEEPVDGDVAICTETAKTCGDGVSSDVVVDEEGNVIDVICYSEEVISVDEIEANEGNVQQNQNNTAVVLDGTDDGVDLEGNLDVDANGVVIYGEGPDVSLMSGDLDINGNKIIVRGIRVQGNVSIFKNESVILYCVIEGNVTVSANGAHVSGCDIFGDVVVKGNNNVFVGNRLQGSFSDTGKNTRCEANTSFKDVNQDGLIDDSEVGGSIACGAPKKN